MGTIKEMRIDEDKENATFKLEKKEKEVKKVYSDHNVIIVKIDFVTDLQQEQKKKVITKKGYEEYNKVLQEREISKIVENGSLQIQYDKWSQVIEKSIKK